jgi:DNA-binding NarL/FixJ family response regulator
MKKMTFCPVIGMYIAFNHGMKTILLSRDQDLIDTIRRASIFSTDKFVLLNKSSDALDIMSTVCSEHPTLLIADDDFLKPKSAHILKSIKKVNKHIYIIFLFSELSIELGREVSPLGIHYYALKPFGVEDLIDVVHFIAKLKYKENAY